MNILAFIAALFSALWTLLFGWDTVPVTGRSQLLGIDDRTVRALSHESYAQIMAEADVVRGGEAVDAIDVIVARLSGPADALLAERGDTVRWQVRLVRAQTPNAFALPAGQIVVHTGMLPVSGIRDGLASVIGHEMAHVIARHGEERMTQQQLANLGQFAVAAALGDMDPGVQAVVLGAFGLGTRFGVLNPFSRTHEAEADEIGMMLMAEACFDPRAAPAIWERMMRLGGQTPEFLSTHPSHGSRIRELSALVDEAMAVPRPARPFNNNGSYRKPGNAYSAMFGSRQVISASPSRA